MNLIPFTVTIDTEEEWDWSGPFPVRDLSVSNIHQLGRFQSLCDKYDIRPTYFCNHAVIANRASAEIITKLSESENVEIGMHLHPWNTPPIQSETVGPGESFTHNLSPGAQIEKLQATFDSLVDAGITPKSFRGGRYSSGDVVQKFLVEHQFLVDSSVCPYTSWPDDGAPDYCDRGLEPTRIEFGSGEVLWEVPLTMVTTRRPYDRWLKIFNRLESPALAKLRLIGILNKLGVASRVWLNFECEEAHRIVKFLDIAASSGLGHLTFTVHSSSLSPGPGPYCQSEQDCDRILLGIESVFQVLQREPIFQPATMSQLAGLLEEKYHEGFGN
ncbi:hypothetical protein [Thalassoglobus sp.]|uniref:hypothetical protein n=1 Tax=Thalassoglobus sp. TaxID=2795869 RepID=UPI003AA8BE20